jgi:hypothetical protein
MPNIIKPVALCFALFCASQVEAEQRHSLVTESFLDQIKGLEDRDGKDGDNGNSRGPYQISKGVHKDITSYLLKEGKTAFSWNEMRLEVPSRYYCMRYCMWIEAILLKRYGNVTPAMIYAAYNAGINTFIKSGGKVKNMSQAVRERCAIF